MEYREAVKSWNNGNHRGTWQHREERAEVNQLTLTPDCTFKATVWTIDNKVATLAEMEKNKRQEKWEEHQQDSPPCRLCSLWAGRPWPKVWNKALGLYWVLNRNGGSRGKWEWGRKVWGVKWEWPGMCCSSRKTEADFRNCDDQGDVVEDWLTWVVSGTAGLTVMVKERKGLSRSVGMIFF